MDPDRTQWSRRLLVKIGFKEIEVAYPSSSESDFEFCRYLIENNEVPDDVSLQVDSFSHLPIDLPVVDGSSVFRS